MWLSKHFRLLEMIRSTTALRLGIDNTPPDWAVLNLIMLCERILEVLRDMVGLGIWIHGAWRCKALNDATPGSSRNSQHMKGQAADIEVPGISAEKLHRIIYFSQLPYDQVILEYPKTTPDGPDGWVHVSWAENPRHESLIKRAGEPYLPYIPQT